MNRAKICTNVVRAACALGALAIPSIANAQFPSVGMDVVYSDITGTSNFGVVGGIRAYALSSNTCNVGNQNLVWSGMGGSPTLVMNAYRLYQGRLVQIGMGWGKTACCAAAGGGCPISCNGSGGSVLGSGCLDVYSAGYNGGQSRLQSRASVNPYTGVMQAPTNPPNPTVILRRLQVHESDMSPITYPGALYFVEGLYIGADEAGQHPENAMNNASYKRVTVNPTSYDMTPTGAVGLYKTGINAWHDHGLGAGVVDPSVHIVAAPVPGEGTFYVASKIVDLGGSPHQWRYEYSVYNLNSDRAAGGFTLPLPGGVAVNSIGFHDVDYHSGDPYDNTDWTMPNNGADFTSSVNGTLAWNSPQTYSQNPNSNALRWGTMYNYWFIANVEPGQGSATITLFKPGTPTSITVTTDVPTEPPCIADLNFDGLTLVNDIFSMISRWFAGDVAMNWNHNNFMDVGDIFAYLGDWFKGCH